MTYHQQRRYSAGPTIGANPSPPVLSMMAQLSGSRKQQLIAQAQEFWPVSPPVSPAQMAYYQGKAVLEFLPFRVNDGLPIASATVRDFYQ